MYSSITRFLRDEEGATAIEYGIIAGMMAVLLAAIFSPTGTLYGALNTMFGKITTALTIAP